MLRSNDYAVSFFLKNQGMVNLVLVFFFFFARLSKLENETQKEIRSIGRYCEKIEM